MSVVFSEQAAGDAPAWTTEPRAADELRSYFENQYGEPWIASATPDRLRVTGEDIDWRTIEVEAPDYLALYETCINVAVTGFHGVVVNAEEKLWLAAVMLAARVR